MAEITTHINSVSPVWYTTVNELILRYKEMLVALIPHLHSVHIPIGASAGSHQWDEIAEVIYKNVVVDSIRYSLNDIARETFDLAVYEMIYEDYRNISFIEIYTNNLVHEEEKLAFHSFDFSYDAIVTEVYVKGIVLNSDYTKKAFLNQRLKLEDCYFKCQVLVGETRNELDHITVEL